MQTRKEWNRTCKILKEENLKKTKFVDFCRFVVPEKLFL